jgi:xanthine dehydrogenase iron-sulfur cluster and FAD-binding subunit A
MMWKNYLQPTSLDEALRLLDEHAGRARIVAGGTDVLVELQRGVRPTETLIDISKLRELKYVRAEDGRMRLGALATHNDVIASQACRQYALPLAQACWEVGAPQIRTRATVAGNLVTASPANDTIVPLMALGAEVALTSVAGERMVPLDQFYTGFRRTALQPNELLREIRFPMLGAQQRGMYIKLGLRRAQAISVINLALVLTFAEASSAQSAICNLQSAIIQEARVVLGCLAPTVVHARTVEAFLQGKQLTPEVCAEAGRLANGDVAPIDDVRGSATYRRATLAALVTHGLQRIAAGREAGGMPEKPVLLETKQEPIQDSAGSRFSVLGSDIITIHTTINGQPRVLENAQGKSLLHALRENAGLTGTKEGCAEGECGACTVWLDGQAVMACLVPAGQAHGATITTIEGLAGSQKTEALSHDHLHPSSFILHPLQAAFVAHGAVQCGYCIPGFLMAGAKLLEEIGQPTREQAQVALSGNICRCTGYRKILDAVLATGYAHHRGAEKEN